VNFNFKIVNDKYVFLQNGFISISCITVKSFINFRDNLEVVLVKKKRGEKPQVTVHASLG
jgi:hypothetical protein